MNFNNFSCLFLSQNVLTSPSPKIPQGAKCANTSKLHIIFAPKGKPLLDNKGTESLNLLHPLLFIVITLSTLPLLAPKDNKTFLQFQKTGNSILCQIILCYVCLLICTCVKFKLPILFQFSSKTTLSLITYTLSAKSTRKLHFYCKRSSIFFTNCQFCLPLSTILTAMFLSKLLVSFSGPQVSH